MEQLALIVPGMWADHHVIAVRGLFRDTEDVQVTGASAMDATLRLEYDPAKTDPQKIAAQLEQAGYPTGEAPGRRCSADGQAGVAHGRGARHRHRSGRPHHVGRPPQVLIADRPCASASPRSARAPGPLARRGPAPAGVKESPHG